jgi:hypothetical protein
MKQYINFIFLAFVILFLIFLIFIKKIDTVSNSYKNYEELISIPNILNTGWIPNWLPKSAFNIEESHNIDTNEVWLIFNFLPQDKFYSSCTLIEKKEVDFFLIDRVKEFPNFVKNNFKSLFFNNSLIFYKCNITNLAIDFNKNFAYVWILPN